MDAMDRLAKREMWTKRIERWKESGLTTAEFATEIGVNAHSLKWWKWRVRADARGYKAPSRRRSKSKARPTALAKQRRPKLKKAPPMTFVEMPKAAVDDERLEVVFPTGIRIRVQTNFDVVTLERLFALLGRSR